MTLSTFRANLRAIVLPVAFSGLGLTFAFLLKKGLGLQWPKIAFSLLALAFTSTLVLLLFPKVFGIPFGPVDARTWLRRLGLWGAQDGWRHARLGVFAALFTLSGMLVGTVATGKYQFDPATLTLNQAVFSLTPGIWEEVLFRGVLMIVLVRLTGSVFKAGFFQILLFGLAHLKGLSGLAWVEVVSVMVIATAFTYLAVRTRSLIPGILFHWAHDTFLFTVQLPKGEYTGLRDNALFYAGLWTGVLLCLGMIRLLGTPSSSAPEDLP